MTLSHKPLIKLLQMAYSAEKAAAFAYQGHAASVKKEAEKAAIRQIELDEWGHRAEVLKIMQQYEISPSKYYELRFYVVGKIIHINCFLIGWFMPFYFAGRLESGNVCEYFRLKQYFNELGITGHDHILYEMGIKEKEHEVYFYEQIKDSKLLPFFEKFFSWGATQSMNDIDIHNKASVEESGKYCRK